MPRSKAQREEDLNKIARMYVKRVPQMQMAKELGISQGQVSNDLRLLLKKWSETRTHEIDMFKGQQLESINAIEQEMWESWEKSKTLVKKTHTKSKSGQFGKILNPITGKMETMPDDQYWRAGTVEEEARGGDMQYMNGIMWCVSERAKILGLYAPKKVSNTDSEGKDHEPISAKEVFDGLIGSIVKRLKPSESSVEGEVVEEELPDNLNADKTAVAKQIALSKMKKLPAYVPSVESPQSVEIDSIDNLEDEELNPAMQIRRRA